MNIKLLTCSLCLCKLTRGGGERDPDLPHRPLPLKIKNLGGIHPFSSRRGSIVMYGNEFTEPTIFADCGRSGPMVSLHRHTYASW